MKGGQGFPRDGFIICCHVHSFSPIVFIRTPIQYSIAITKLPLTADSTV